MSAALVKAQRWGQVSGNPAAIHRPERFDEVVVLRPVAKQVCAAQGSSGPKGLSGQAKIAFSTGSRLLYQNYQR
jgi:hypothetical protein